MKLADWQQRVIEEREQLTDRINKLSDFLDSDNVFNITRDDHLSLQEQRSAMIKYEQCLNDRISRFPKDVPPTETVL